jgi:predicted kinase
MDALPRLWVITGLMAAGKSTVAQALAERFERAVHLRGDTYRKMVVRGRAEMSPEPSADALAQLALRYRLACEAALAYVDAGFTVVYQDVILGAHLADVARQLSRHEPAVVVLNPSLDVVAERDRDRAKTGYAGDWTPHRLAGALDETPRIGLWLDTSVLTVPETVDRILAEAALARRLTAHPGESR